MDESAQRTAPPHQPAQGSNAVPAAATTAFITRWQGAAMPKVLTAIGRARVNADSNTYPPT